MSLKLLNKIEEDRPEGKVKDSSGHVKDVRFSVGADDVDPDVGGGNRGSFLRRKDEDLWPML